MSSNVQRPKKLIEQAIEQDVTPEDLVRRTLNDEGTVYAAAIKLKVSRNTISYWLRKMGATVETRRVTTLKEKVS